MIVAVALMRMMKAAIHQIIDVIVMRDGFVPAARAVAMTIRVNLGGAAHRIFCTDLDHVLFNLPIARMHEAAVFQVIHMIAVPNGLVTAIGAVFM